MAARVIAENRPHATEHEGVAIVSRLPLDETAVWPLPPSHPPRHRLPYRGVHVSASGTIALRDEAGSASDHLLVWADAQGRVDQ